jgi:uncharacterized protein
MFHDTQELPSTQVDVSNLLDAPGKSRPVQLDVPVPADFEVPLNAFGDEVSVDGVLESLVDGVLLRGTVSAEVTQQCATCLTDIPSTTVVAHVAELFTEPSADDADDEREPGYEIDDAMIDVETLIRDALSEATPAAPKCRPDCAGLCPTCGIDRNTATCDCEDVDVDDRWSALSDLKLNP